MTLLSVCCGVRERGQEDKRVRVGLSALPGGQGEGSGWRFEDALGSWDHHRQGKVQGGSEGAPMWGQGEGKDGGSRMRVKGWGNDSSSTGEGRLKEGPMLPGGHGKDRGLRWSVGLGRDREQLHRLRGHL